MDLGAFMLNSQPAIADDFAGLKAAHKSFTQAWNTGDAEASLSFWQLGGIF